MDPSSDTTKAIEALIDTLVKCDTNELPSGHTRGHIIQLLALDELKQHTSPHISHINNTSSPYKPRWSRLMSILVARFYSSSKRRESTSHALCQSFTDLFGSGLPAHELFASLKDLPSVGVVSRTNNPKFIRNESSHRCHRQWFDGDLAYHCAECAVDPQCAICVECFDERVHLNHHVTLIAASSGFCDCGDRFAWHMDGACLSHRNAQIQDDNPPNMPSSARNRIDQSGVSPSDEHSSDDEDGILTSNSVVGQIPHNHPSSSVDLASRSNEDEVWQWINSATASDRRTFPFDSDGALIDELFPCRLYTNFAGLVYCVCSWLRSLPSSATRHRKFGSLSRVLSWMRKISRNRTMLGALAFALCQPFDSSAPSNDEERMHFEKWVLDRCPLGDSRSSTCLSYLFSLCVVPGPVRTTSRLDRSASEVISTMLSVAWNECEVDRLRADQMFVDPLQLSFKRYLLHALMQNYKTLVASNSTLPPIASVQLLKSSALIECIHQEKALQNVLYVLQAALSDASRSRSDGSLVVDSTHPALLAQRHYQPKIDCIYLLRQRPVCQAFVSNTELLVALSTLTSGLEGMNIIKRISSGAHVKFESDSWQYAFELEHDIQQINAILQQFAKDSGASRTSFWHWRWLAILACLIEQHFARNRLCDANVPLCDRLSLSPLSFHWPVHRSFAKLWIQQLLVSSSDEFSALCAFGQQAFRLSVDQWWLTFAIAPLRLSGCVGEMRAGLWIRNGESVHGSQACYRSPSFATQGATADIAAVQCATIMASCDETSALHIVHTAIRSFSIDLLGQCDIDPIIDDAAWLVLTGECLSHIMSLMCDRTSWITDHVSIRSELVHALAAHPAPSHSTLLSSLAETHARSCFTSVIDTVLQEVAIFTPARLQHPGHYVMKPHIWNEFNPFYHRYLPPEVAAAELRFKDCKLLEPSTVRFEADLEATRHPFQLDWLLCMVHSPTLHAVVLTVLSAALEAQGSSGLAHPSIMRRLNTPSNHSHERALRAALHLIAIALLTLDDTDTNEQLCDVPLDKNCTGCSRVTLHTWGTWYDVNRSCTALPADLEHALLTGTKLERSSAHVSRCRMATTRKFVSNACVALSSLRWTEYSVDLIRLNSRILSRQLKIIRFIEPSLQEDFVRSARLSARAQTEARQTLVLRAFQQQQKSFLSKHAILSTSNINSETSLESASAVTHTTSRVCCLCRDDTSHDTRAFGEVCLVQRSGLYRLLKQNQCRFVADLQRISVSPIRRPKKRKHGETGLGLPSVGSSAATALSDQTDGQNNEGEFVIVSCHHLMHVDCHAQFMTSSGRLNDGSFQCPACRRAANVLAPVHDSMQGFTKDQLTVTWINFVQALISQLKLSTSVEPLDFLSNLIEHTINVLELMSRDRAPPRSTASAELDHSTPSLIFIHQLEHEVKLWSSVSYEDGAVQLIRSLRQGHSHLCDKYSAAARNTRDHIVAVTNDLSRAAASEVSSLLVKAALYVCDEPLLTHIHSSLYQVHCWQVAVWVSQFIRCVDLNASTCGPDQPALCCLVSLVADLSSSRPPSISPYIWHTTRAEILQCSVIASICRLSIAAFNRRSSVMSLPGKVLVPIIHNHDAVDKGSLLFQDLSLVHELRRLSHSEAGVSFDLQSDVELGFPFSLHALPVAFSSILSSAPSHCCESCQTPLAPLTSLCCLFCGAFVCPSLKHRCVVRHSLKCSAGVCCMLAVKRTDCVIGDCHISAFCHWPPLYLDQYQDTDINLQRGRALTLNQQRLQALTIACRAHTLIPFVKQHTQAPAGRVAANR